MAAPNYGPQGWVWAEPLLADEGGLMMSSMAPSATALQLGLSAAYSATAPALVFKNNAAVNVPNSPRCLLRHIHFLCAVPPTSGTSLLYATVIDSANRTPTTVSNGAGGAPGTPATQTAYQPSAICANMDTAPTANGQWWFPLSTAAGAPPVVPAAGANARTLVGNGNLRSVIPVGAASSGIQDDYRILFGSTDPAGGTGLRSSAGATLITEVHPGIVIGPQEYFLLYLWCPSNITAGFAFAGLDCSWIER